MKLKPWVRVVLVLLVLALTGLITEAIVHFVSNGATPSPAVEPTPVPTPEPTAEPTPEPTPEAPREYELSEEKLAELQAELQADKAKNPDVKCLLHFNNNLIHDPVLQTDDENYYLYKNWETLEYQSYGSIVLDARNDIEKDEQNTIIYGHYIYEFRNPDRTLVFTPLAELMDKSVYENNKYVSLITDDEVRYYEIARVYDCPLESTAEGQFTIYGMEYNLLQYDQAYLDLYLKNIDEHEYYDIDVELTPRDHFLTLQTCIENHHESREIVLCREIERVGLN